MIIGRRGFIGGLIGLVAAPAIVRLDNIMPVRVWNPLPKGPFISLFNGDPLMSGREIVGGGYHRLPLKLAPLHEGLYIDAMFPTAMRDWGTVTHLVADGVVIQLETPRVISHGDMLQLGVDPTARAQTARTFPDMRQRMLDSL